MSSARLGGVICPLATPLTDDELLDEDALTRLIQQLLPEVDGFLALGTSGESAVLRTGVAEHVVEVTLAAVGGRVPVIVNIGDTGTARVLDRLSDAWAGRVNAVAATSGYYIPHDDQASLIGHFTAIAERSPVPLVLYNIPQNTHSQLLPTSLAELAHHPNVVGIKDSWGDFIQFQEFLSVVPDGFTVLQGREQLAAASGLAGGSGVVSGLANLAPRFLHQVLAAVRDGDVAGARAAQRQVAAAARVFEQGNWLAVLKYLLGEQGIGNGRPARPLAPLDSVQAAAACRLWQEHGAASSPFNGAVAS